MDIEIEGERGREPGVGKVDAREMGADAGMLSVVSGLVCAAYGISAGDLHAPTRLLHKIARARQVAVYLSHVGLGIRLNAAAAWFGRDPSTGSHACHLIENSRDVASVDLALARLEHALIRWRVDNPFHDPSRLIKTSMNGKGA